MDGPGFHVEPDVLDTASQALVASEAGEIIVWVTGGRLSGLEFAWVTDEPTGRWPSPEELDVR